MSRANPRFRRNNPPLPAAPANCWQLSVLGYVENQVTVNTFYYRDAGLTLAADLSNEANLRTGFDTNVIPSFKACISSDWAMTSIVVRCINVPTRAAFVYNYNPVVAGTGAATHMPTTTAAVLSRRTAVRGQCGRGRLYIPAPPVTSQAAVNNSYTTATYQTTLAALATAMKTAFVQTAMTFTPGLASKGPRTQNPRVSGFADLTNVIVVPVYGTIRRRRIGRGK